MFILTKVLHNLIMISEDKLKKSEASENKKILANIPILIKNLTNTERVLWNLA
jgi:hypothetical protein